MLVDDLKL